MLHEENTSFTSTKSSLPRAPSSSISLALHAAYHCGVGHQETKSILIQSFFAALSESLDTRGMSPKKGTRPPGESEVLVLLLEELGMLAKRRCLHRAVGSYGWGVASYCAGTVQRQRNAPKWVDKERRRDFMEAVAAAKGFKASEAHRWQQVTIKDVDAMGGGAMLRKRYNGSVFAALQDLFPELEASMRETRRKLPHRFWVSADNRRSFMDSLAEKHGIACMEDWKSVRTTDVTALGGGPLLNRYRSFFALLQDIYPDGYGGQEWSLFACRDRVPQGHWQSRAGIVDFVERASRELNLVTAEDWYRVSFTQLTSVQGGAGLLRKMRLFDILTLAMPKEHWDEAKLASSCKKAVQRGLFRQLSSVFM